jgi:phytoene synthase
MTTTDEARCRQIVRTHARTFWLASHFLGPEKRRGAFALYAFCRVADDLVDLAIADASRSPAEDLAEQRRLLTACLEGRPSGPVYRELHRTVTAFDIPPAVLYELLDGIGRDCLPSRYASWDELQQYCEGVASSVGEMCTHVFGVAGDDDVRRRALRHARTLGVAMQLTNILRDVGEDARRGRCYLPDAELARFGLDRERVLAGTLGRDDRWKAFMQFQVERARDLYERAMPGIALLSPDARRCATACAVGYAGILGAIESIDYDTFSTRARLGTRARAGVLWNVWRNPAVADHEVARSRTPGADGHGDKPMVHWA